MNTQLKAVLIKAKLNFIILASILALAVVGKFASPEMTNTIFITADQLVSGLYLVFIAITLGAFVPNFRLIAYGAIGMFIAAAIFVHLGFFNYLTTEYLLAVLIVTLGFASIANLYRGYKDISL